jgi:predicted DNA-binding transcriptional regulator AlpA
MSVNFNNLPQAVEELNNRLDRLEQLLKEVTASAGGDQANELMGVPEAARFLGLKTSTLYTKVSREEIPVSKKGKKLIFSRQRLIQWSLEGERQPKSEKRQKAIENMRKATKKQNSKNSKA